MSPGDLGQVLKPFVFLDLFDIDPASFAGIGLHPHSGIATVTYLFQGSVRYEDTTGRDGEIPQGGVEWFKAGHGAWHGGGPGSAGRSRGFQLWIALPADQELGPVESIYLAPEGVAHNGTADVIVGTYGVASPLPAPSSMRYLAVRLRAGESWHYQPALDHTVGWVAVGAGRLLAPEPVAAGELVMFEPTNEPIELLAELDAELVLGSAAPHAHDLALGSYSVHTSPETLRLGEQRINEIKRRLQHEGRL